MQKTKRFTKKEWSWIMYDWANSIYATNIMAAIFPIYFAAVATEQGNQIYGFAVSIANLLVAVLAPMLGAIGDFKGMKKKLFVGALVIGLVFTLVMAVFGSWQLMLVGLIISRIGFSGSCLFYDSFLTDVTKPERMDRLSAWGYAMGYIGGSTFIPGVTSKPRRSAMAPFSRSVKKFSQLRARLTSYAICTAPIAGPMTTCTPSFAYCSASAAHSSSLYLGWRKMRAHCRYLPEWRPEVSRKWPEVSRKWPSSSTPASRNTVNTRS